jgi:uncharacterized protein
MTIASIFINPEESRLRAGWRMLIFLLVFAALGALVSRGLVPLLTKVGIVRSRLASQVITAVLLLIVTWVVTRFIDKRPLQSVGLGFHDRTLTELMQGVVLGTVMMGVIFAVLVSLGMAQFQLKVLTIQQALGMTAFCLAEFTLVAVNEEVMTRGYLFQTLAEG